MTEQASEPGAGSPVRGARLSADARREQLVTCAARLFGELPYDRVSTSLIAREAGIARGLLNHYFGDKRGLYLEVVRRAVLLPLLQETVPTPTCSLEERVELSVDWFLDSVASQGPTYLTVLGAEGVGKDPEVAAILDSADDLAARRVLEVTGLDPDDDTARAVVRAYGGLAKATVREWDRGGHLSREQAHRLLSDALLAIVTRTLPHLSR